MIKKKFCECLLCNKKDIKSLHSHLRKHNISLQDYLAKFPDAEVSNPNEGKSKSAESKMRTSLTLKETNKNRIIVPWNRGLTKEIDIRIRRMSDNIKGSGNPMFEKCPWNLGLTKKIDERIMKYAIANTGRITAESTKQILREKALKQFEQGMPQGTRNKIGFASRGDKNPAKRPKVRMLLRTISLKLWEDNEFRQKHSGRNSHFFRGRGSIEKYSDKFNNRLRKEIKTRDGYVCQYCGKPERIEINERKRLLSVHHINYDKKNADKLNLITLCTKCHAVTTSGDRLFWEEFFKELNTKRL